MVNIEIKSSPIHGRGIFAVRNFKEGEKIIEYVGEKIRKKESTRRAIRAMERARLDPSKGAVYIFDLDENWDIDGDVEWNEARLINHSCAPNCETSIREGHIWILAMVHIKKGDELLYNYGYDLEHYTQHPCRCGAPTCVGYIVSESEWEKLRKMVAENSATVLKETLKK